jgi:hypothetical protein
MKKIALASASFCWLCQTFSFGYGERLNLPEGAVVTADFIDYDDDNIDDRHQPAPGIASPRSHAPSIPRVEYLGGAEILGVPDLRTGVRLHGLWNCIETASTCPSVLIGGKMEDSHPAVEALLSAGMPLKKFTFPEGIAIYYAEGSKYALTATPSGYYAFTIPEELRK